MYFRAGVFSLGLLLLSRVLGLLRESAQAAAFGASAVGDAVIVMFTLPDLLVGVLVSGALAYVLLPAWAQQSADVLAAGQRKMARGVVWAGLAVGLLVWLCRGSIAHTLAPGLGGDMQHAAANALGWSALVLPLAMLAALWVTRLQHERDFVGMYAGNLVVNAGLVAGLAWVALWAGQGGQAPGFLLNILGVCLVLAMLGRLGWLAWRLPRRSTAGLTAEVAVGTTANTMAGTTAGAKQTPIPTPPTAAAQLPPVSVWLWAALSSGLLLVFPLVARSLASGAGEGALATFNYAFKLIELPLVLAVQLVASLAFPAITRTAAGTPERQRAVGLAFLVAWALACAAVAVVATFSMPIAKLLFGWGRMNEGGLAVIARWSGVGIWSLLPQALLAVLLTVMAAQGRMRPAVAVLSGGLAVLLALGWFGSARLAGTAALGLAVMWALNGVFAVMALLLMLIERRSVFGAFPMAACLGPLLVCAGLVAFKPLLAGLGLPLVLLAAALFAGLVVGSAALASPVLRALWHSKFVKKTPAIAD